MAQSRHFGTRLSNLVVERGIPNCPKGIQKCIGEAPLPPGCPPDDAAPPFGIFLRLIPSNSVVPDDFLSIAEKGRRCPKKISECMCRAYSLWAEDTPHEVLADLTKYPNLRGMKYVAHIEFDASSGRMKQNGNHASIWMYATFRPEQAVKAILPI